MASEYDKGWNVLQKSELTANSSKAAVCRVWLVLFRPFNQSERMKPDSIRNHLGFTLIELMVTLSVLAILLAIAIPNFQSFVLNSRLTATTNDLVSALAVARSEAVKRATRVTVCKSADSGAASPTCSAGANWQDGWIVFVDSATAGTVDGTDSDNILRVFQPTVNNGMAIDGGTNFANWLSYLPSGVSVGDGDLANGTFTVDFATCPSPATTMARTIVLNATGRVITTRVDCT